MSSRVEDLRGLAQMLDEGKISQSEYELVKSEILEAPAEEWATPATPTETISNGAGTPLPEERADEESGDETTSFLQDWLTFAKQVPRVYWYALGGVLVVLIFGILLSGRPTPVDARPLPASAQAASPEPPVGSLGLRFEDLADAWNALDQPPYILKGISITPEAGSLDSFIYRFDGGALLAGAYNPSDEHVYALMARAGLGHESVSEMYVHLCYLLYPGTQECFDAYVEESGVFGKSPEELTGIDHFATWQFDGNEWRVEIEGDVQTIRVLGPQEAG